MLQCDISSSGDCPTHRVDDETCDQSLVQYVGRIEFVVDADAQDVVGDAGIEGDRGRRTRRWRWDGRDRPQVLTHHGGRRVRAARDHVGGGAGGHRRRQYTNEGEQPPHQHLQHRGDAFPRFQMSDEARKFCRHRIALAILV